MTDGETTRKRGEDLELARAIGRGSLEAWHAFVHRYSGLIYSILTKYLFDAEDVRTLYVETLEHLYKGSLGSYQGRSALSTWLVLVTRNKALDHLRKRSGRRDMPAGLGVLSGRDREIFRLYYLEGRDFEAVRRRIGESWPSLSADALLAALRRIERAVDPRIMRRIADNLYAESVGAASGRLLEYLERSRADMVARGPGGNPEVLLLEAEARRLHEAVRESMACLSPEEREILELTFDRGMSARSIAERLKLTGARRVYALKTKALRKLRAYWTGESFARKL